MRTNFARKRLFVSTALMGTVMLGGAAFAQTAPMAPSTAPGAPPVQEVIVTGSRIASPNVQSISPVTTVSAQDFKSQGITRVEDLLNQLPQVFADQGSAISNGANGTANVNLRGLGSVRTLVLLDGRRIQPGDPNDTAVDLNFIPTILIDRVDVDTGGASATYGSDAIAGVVNFITKKNFQGVSLDLQYSGYQHDNNNTTLQALNASYKFPAPSGGIFDGDTVSLQGMIGVNAPDGKGNLTAYASYRNIDAVTQADRDYSSCTLNDASQTAFGCGGSGTAAAARIGAYHVSGTSLIANAVTPNPVFNFGPYNYYQRPDTRYNFGVQGHYEINKAADVYTQLMFMDDDSVAQIAPGGVFAGTFSIPCNNAFLSAQEATTLCGANAGSATSSFSGTVARRNVEGGGRATDYRHTDYRGVIGVRGELGSAWNYDAYASFGETILATTTSNYFSVTRIKNALQAVRNSAGQIVCANGGSDGCVPYNLFADGGVTAAALNYLEVPAFTKGANTEQVIDANITGRLGEYGIRSPFSDEGVGVNFGTQYRKERITFSSDSLSSSGDLSGSGGASPPVNGSFDVYELYTELRAPLVNDKPFIKSLSVEAGYRFSQYSTSAGVTGTSKLGIEYAPITELRFRGSWQHAVRAPNIDELYTPQALGLGLVADYCAGKTPKYTAAQCANSGVTAAEYGNIEANPAAQYNTVSGGNLNLSPEISNTYSAGVVWTPRYIGGLSLSADFFNIAVARVIGAGLGGADNQLIQCITTGNPVFCNTVHRDQSAGGTLFLTQNGYVTTTELNGGELQSEGVDFNGDYKLPLSRFGLENFGSLALNAVGTYQIKLRTKPTPGGLDYNCSGLYGSICGISNPPTPYWRHKVRLTWITPFSGAQISAQWRYYGAVKADGLSSQTSLAGNSDSAYAIDNHFGAQSYLDLTASIRLKDRYTFRIGVNNVLDQDPPLSGLGATGQFNGNTYPQMYDALGRYLFVGLTADF